MKENPQTAPQIPGSFMMIWIGQLVSIIGSELTAFALSVWVFRTTGSITQFTFILFCATAPNFIISPFAGALVDRFSRRTIMIMSDSISAAASLGAMILIITGYLEVWHLFIITFIASVATNFQRAAYSASIPLLVSKEKLGNVNGMVQMAYALGYTAGPILGAVLLTTIDLYGVVFIDLCTFLFALTMLLLVRIPQPDASEEGTKGAGNILSEIKYGLTYLVSRTGLIGLLFLFAILNFLTSMAGALFTPLILAVTSMVILGSIMSAGGVSMIVGSIIMTMWGGPKRRVYGMLGSMLAVSVAICVCGMHPSIPFFLIGMTGCFIVIPISGGCFYSLWQTKIEPDIQGRAFGIANSLTSAMMPMAYLCGGILADYIFEPLLSANGLLADTVGRFIGTGPGRGIGFLFIILGILCLICTSIGFVNKDIRLIDTALPDVTIRTQEKGIMSEKDDTVEMELT